jgi:hypothetical protein
MSQNLQLFDEKQTNVISCVSLCNKVVHYFLVWLCIFGNFLMSFGWPKIDNMFITASKCTHILKYDVATSIIFLKMCIWCSGSAYTQVYTVVDINVYTIWLPTSWLYMHTKLCDGSKGRKIWNSKSCFLITKLFLLYDAYLSESCPKAKNKENRNFRDLLKKKLSKTWLNIK